MAEVGGARARRWPRAVVVLGAVTVAVMLGSSTAQAVPRGFFGMDPNDDLTAADYQLMRQANVGAAREDMFWDFIEPTEGQFDWSFTDRQVGGFASRGILFLPALFATPSWLANDVATPPVGSDRAKGAWERFVRAAVNRYGQDGTYWTDEYPVQFPGASPKPITTWQIWNEQNGPKHFAPRPNVKKYATLLKIASRAVEDEDPGAKILTGGMASKPTGPGGINAWKYVEKLAKKAGSSFDYVGLHPYARNHREIVSHVKKMRRALKKGKKKQAQVWITEVGWSSDPSGVSPKLSTTLQGQAKRLTKTYQALKKGRKKWKIGGVYWYTWRDFSSGVCDWCPNAGLVTRNLEPKPAFNAYGEIAG